jgi:hypothetical protein
MRRLYLQFFKTYMVLPQNLWVTISIKEIKLLILFIIIGSYVTDYLTSKFFGDYGHALPLVSENRIPITDCNTLSVVKDTTPSAFLLDNLI